MSTGGLVGAGRMEKFCFLITPRSRHRLSGAIVRYWQQARWEGEQGLPERIGEVRS